MLKKIRQNLLVGETKFNLAAMVFLILLIGVSVTFYSDMYVPTLPQITEAFNTTPSHVQFSITIYLFAVAVSQLVYGPLSDRFGRRVILFSGLIISLIGSILCVKATTIEALIIGRLVQGSGIGTCLCLVRAISRDTFEGTRLAKVASYLSMGSSIAATMAPVVGGYFAAWFGWHANFEILIGISAAMLILTWLFLPETLKDKDVDAMRPWHIAQGYIQLITNRTFMGYVICTSMASAGIISYFTMSPFVMQYVLGMTMMEYSWLAIFITAVIFSGRLLNVYLLSRFRLEQMMGAGVILMCMGGLFMLVIGFLIPASVVGIMVPMLVFCFGASFVTCNGMAGALSPIKRKSGSAGAVFGGIQILGSVLLSGMAALFHDNSQIAMGIILSGGSFIGLIALNFTIIRDAKGWRNFLTNRAVTLAETAG